MIITSGEAEVLAEAIMNSPTLRKNARAILAKLDAQTKRLEAWAHDGGDDIEALRKAWWHSRETCALLDDVAQTCGAYSDRPSPCRTYHVVSDPSLCGERGVDGESIYTQQLQMSEGANQYILMRLATAAHEAGLDVLVGSLPQLLGTALRRKLGLDPRSPSMCLHLG